VGVAAAARGGGGGGVVKTVAGGQGGEGASESLSPALPSPPTRGCAPLPVLQFPRARIARDPHRTTATPGRARCQQVSKRSVARAGPKAADLHTGQRCSGTRTTAVEVGELDGWLGGWGGGRCGGIHTPFRLAASLCCRMRRFLLLHPAAAAPSGASLPTTHSAALPVRPNLSHSPTPPRPAASGRQPRSRRMQPT
jgi:hypothetical protein